MDILTSMPMRRTESHQYQTFVASKTVAHVLADIKPSSYRTLVDLPVTATMEEAFDVLLAEDILSVPIYTLDDEHNKTYVAIVSALDLLKLFSTGVTQEALLKSVGEAVGMTTESSELVTVRPSDSLESLMMLFLPFRVHRVLVQGDGSPILLSQMDIIRYLQSHNHQLGHILDLTVPDIVQATRAGHSRLETSIQSVSFKTKAIDAFLKIAHDPYISTVSIVDDSGCLVGDIGPQDLRGLNRDRFETLEKPVMMFLKESHGDFIPPLPCHQRFTLSQIMSAFVLRNTNRIWWCDNEGQVCGVITLSDLLSVFI